MLYWPTHTLFNWIRPFLFPVRVYGRENIPSEGGCLLACNHQSNLDPFLIGLMMRRRMRFMAKDTLFRSPFLAWLMKEWGAFPVNREKADIRAVKDALSGLRAGLPLLIFPEGTRRRSEGGPRRLNAGVGLLAQKARVPVVPIKIVGTDQVLPPGRKWPRRRSVALIIGPPLIFSEDASHDRIAEEVMAAINALPVPKDL